VYVVHVVHVVSGCTGPLAVTSLTPRPAYLARTIFNLDLLQVAAGGTHSCAVTSSGRMFIWGRASYGRLGLGGGAKDVYSPVEVALPGGHERWKVAAATAGGSDPLLTGTVAYCDSPQLASALAAAFLCVASLVAECAACLK
jgi:hypothetical protein